MLRTKLGLAVATALVTIGGTASAALFSFDPIAGGAVAPGAFFADQIVFSSLGPSTATITDGGGGGGGTAGQIDIDANGLIGGLVSTDTFIEKGLVQFVNFRLGAGSVLPGTSGIDSTYQLFGTYNAPLPGGGILTGRSAIDAGGNLISVFEAPTTAFIYLDYGGVLNNVLDLGTSNLIASLTLDTTALSNCVNPSLGAAQGTCVLNFDMASAFAGVWTVGGTDIATAGGKLQIDLNADQLSPPFTQVFAGGSGSTQSSLITHDGSARIDVNQVPEPVTLALLGMGLMGIRLFSRKS